MTTKTAAERVAAWLDAFDADMKRRASINICDCGFTWQHGQSGSHGCTEHYQRTIADLRAAISRQSVAPAEKLDCASVPGALAAAPQSVAVGVDASEGNTLRASSNCP